MQTATLNHYPAPQALPALGYQTAERAEAIRAGLLSVLYFAIANLGYVTPYDSIAFILAVAVIAPTWRPYLLLLVASIHDAPGQADPSVYIGVCGITVLMACALVRRRPKTACLRDW
jgi:hypothetical protein